MKLSQFRYDLPLNLIAQNPTKRREDSRMLVVNRKTGNMENKHFKDILEYFDDKDVFVVNNTKVFSARMYGRKEKTGAKIEVFLLRELNKPNRLWDVIVDPARKIRVGNKLYFGESEELVAEVIDNTTSRGRTIKFLWNDDDESFKKAYDHFTKELDLSHEETMERLEAMGYDPKLKGTDKVRLIENPKKWKRKRENHWDHMKNIIMRRLLSL